MQCLLEAIWICDVVADIAFTAVMAAEGTKVVPTIRAILDADNPLFSCLNHKVIIQEPVYLPCVCLEVGAAKWRAGDGLSHEVTLEVCGAVNIRLNPHDVW